MPVKMEIFDTIIVGASPAGLTAIFYTARLGFKTLRAHKCCLFW